MRAASPSLTVALGVRLLNLVERSFFFVYGLLSAPRGRAHIMCDMTVAITVWIPTIKSM
jgi:hypothetical protein